MNDISSGFKKKRGWNVIPTSTDFKDVFIIY
jgi:hypothetical protein